jgi:hypothetical protein
MGMNAIRAAAIAVVVGALATACAPGNNSPQASAPQQAQERHVLHGYPLDRSLEGLTSWKQLDAVVIVDGLDYHKAVKLSGSAGGVTAIVTPAAGRVKTNLYGRLKDGAAISTVLGGGTVGNVSVTAGEELTPDRAQLTKAPQLVIAGEFVTTPELGTVLDPLFVYRLDADGTLTSLIESGSNDARPSFTLTQLTERLKARPAANLK